MKIILRTVAVLTALLCAKLEAGNLKVTLAPAQAVSAGAQWRVDGGSWRNSDATVSNLSNASHSVDFKTITGWVAPATTTALISNGKTTTLTADYIQTASLKITVNPTSGQWRIDGGSWRTSGATVANLTPGNHAIDYGSVSGYMIPAAETVNLISAQTTSLNRNYVQLAQLTITLLPGSGRWRIDSGAWRNSGTTATSLAPGNHLVDYAGMSGYASPPTETLTLSSGQSLTFSRSYLPLAKLKITLNPGTAQWKVDGGAWQSSAATVIDLSIGSHTIDYAPVSGFIAPASEPIVLTSGQNLSLTRNYVQAGQVSVTLNPNGGQWRLDAGAWLNSGATASNLAPGSHTISYSSLTNYTSPPAENITLAAGQSLTLSRTYAQFAQILIGLVPASGQWRVNGGAWQTSGSSLFVPAGGYLIEYSTLSLYDSPGSENITLATGGIFSTTRTYTSQLPSLQIITTGQWRLDGGAWLPSGARQTGLSAGAHTIDYSDVGGIYEQPPSETITLALRQNASLTRTYSLKPSSIQINLDPNTGVWRIAQNGYASDWQPSGAVLSGLRLSNYNVEYGLMANYDAPAAENVPVTPAQALVLNRTYTPRANLTVTLTPPTAQWNVDGGAWQSSGATLADLSAGLHTISYSSLTGYENIVSEQINLASGQSFSIGRSYNQFAQISVSLNPSVGQWNVDGGSWQTSGSSVFVSSAFQHVINYSNLTDYDPPLIETVTLPPGSSYVPTRFYTSQKPTLRISLTPAINGQWRVDGGTWQNSDALLSELSVGPHLIEYADIGGLYNPLPSETISLGLRENAGLVRAYPLKPLASLSLILNPSSAQWNIDGGPWQASGATVASLLPGTHTLTYLSLPPSANYGAPSTETVNLSAGQSLALSRSYTKLAAFYIILTPSGAQWRIDGGAWSVGGSDFTRYSLSVGVHSIEYQALSGYIAPPSESVTLVAGDNPPILRSYTLLATFGVTLTPSSAQWKIDGGTWNKSGDFFTNLPLGAHVIDYSTVAGYVALPSESVTLVSGINPPLTRSYTPLATFGVNLTPASAQWRIDSGTWNNSGAFFTDLSLGVHTIEYAPVPGYITPLSDSIALKSGINPPLNRTYVPLAYFNVVLNPSNAQWRLDGGAWTNSNRPLFNLALGAHSLEFSDVTGYITPPPQTVTLFSGPNATLNRSYVPLAYFNVVLNPSNAQWRLDGGAWTNSNMPLFNLTLGAHSLEFSDVTGYITPPPETVTLFSGPNATLNRSYVPLAYFNVVLNPPNAQWRLDGGAWTNSNRPLFNLALGAHSLEFADVTGYITPPPETVTLFSGPNPTLNRSYTLPTSGTVSITLVPSTAKWRIHPMDSIASMGWNSSGATISGINPGTYVVEYAEEPGYETPLGENFVLTPNESKILVRTYAFSAFFQVHRFNDSGFDPVTILGSDGYIYCGASTGIPTAGWGHIFRLNQDGTGYLEIKRFDVDSADRTIPSSLIEGSDGLLYGCTKKPFVGGPGNEKIFKMNKDGSGYTVLHVFNVAGEGTAPNSLIKGSDGVLYGTTSQGGNSGGGGTIFRVNADGTGFSSLYLLNNASGIYPLGVVEGLGGMLYGTATDGGLLGAGSLFKLNKDGTAFAVIKNFGNDSNGASPGAGLLAASDGQLYGTTRSGGTANLGVVFRISNDGTLFTILHTFVGGSADGSRPETLLSEDASGILYGATSGGGVGQNGTLFSMNKNGTGFTLLANLSGGAPDGGRPSPRLALSAAGTLFGSDISGGQGGSGTLFKLNIDGAGFTVLRHLGAPEGGNPTARVIQASDGMLYGTTSFGGPKKVGTVYRVNPDGSDYITLRQFNNISDGGNIFAAITESSEGKIYGITPQTQFANSTLYQMNKDGTGCTVVHGFDGLANGTSPQSVAIEASDGKLYGTCSSGGTNNRGGVYQCNKDGSGFLFIHNFVGTPSDGSSPYAELIESADGRLYGTTASGGATNNGTVFGLNKDGTAYAVIHNLTGGTADGARPSARLCEGEDGFLYGTTPFAYGNNLGTIYRVARDGSGYTALKVFSGLPDDGSDPSNTGITEKGGLLYGTTTGGGTFGKGIVYSMNPDGSGFHILVNFGAGLDDGWYPTGGLLIGTDANLYGTTYNGSSGGTLFRLHLN